MSSLTSLTNNEDCINHHMELISSSYSVVMCSITTFSDLYLRSEGLVRVNFRDRENKIRNHTYIQMRFTSDCTEIKCRMEQVFTLRNLYQLLDRYV